MITSTYETRRSGKTPGDNFILTAQQGQDYCSAVRNAAFAVESVKFLLDYVVCSGEKTVFLTLSGSQAGLRI